MKKSTRNPFFVLGIDVGGTKVSFGAISSISGCEEIFSYQKIKTPPTKEEIAQTIINTFQQYKDQCNLTAIGISFPSMVSRHGDILNDIAATGKSWKKFHLKNYLKKSLDVPVFLNNDGQCFVRGEMECGVGKDYINIAALVLGTGVGGGFSIDKKVYKGFTNTAGEFGYLESAVDFNGKIMAISPCGKDMEILYQKLTRKFEDTFVIEKLADEGDKDAVKVMDTLALALAKKITAIIYILNPEIIILGGGISRVKILIEKTSVIMKKKLPDPLLGTKIATTVLNDKANIIGAALFAMDELKIKQLK